MAFEFQTVITVLTTLGAGTVLKGVVDWWTSSKSKKDDQEIKKLEAKIEDESREDTHRFELEKSTIDVLREALKYERDANARFIVRINVLEAHNNELHIHLNIMRMALLASFVNDLDTARALLSSIPQDRVSDPEE